MSLSTTEEAQTRALIAQNAAILSLAASEPAIISKLAATKVSLADLTPAVALDDADLFLVRQGLGEKSVSTAIIKADVLTGLDASDVSYIPAGVGAVATDVQSKLRESVSVKDFGASPSASAAANVIAIQAALDYANSVGGAEVFVPRGTYQLNAQLNIYKKTLLAGEGQQTSILSFTHSGNGIVSTWPINSSTSVWISLQDLGITNTNVANTGAGFVDVGGTFVTLLDCYIGGVVGNKGFGFCVIFDQTELAQIERCDLNLPAVGCVWLVNGTDYSGGARNYTNRITIRDCQFGALPGVSSFGIVDDGGASHSFIDNNYYGFINQIKVAETYCLKIDGGEFEDATGSPIVFRNTRYNGGAAFQAAVSPSIANAFIVAPSGFGCIDFAGGGAQTAVNPYVANCNLSNPNNAAAITGLANISSVKLVANTLANQPLVDVQPLGDLVALGGSSNFFTAIDIPTTAWTPTYIPSAGAFGSITYDTVTGGKYTRIGKMVFIQAVLRTTAITLGTASGVVSIGGLPFPSVANSSGKLDGYFTLQIGFSSGFTTNFPTTALGGASSSSAELLYAPTSNGAPNNLPVGALALGASSNFIVISGCYQCA